MSAASRIDLSRERSMGDILLAAARIYGAYPLLFAILAVAVMAPFELLVLALTGYGPLRDGHENVGTSLIVSVARLALVGPLISALHIHAVVRIGKGERPTLSAVAASGLSVLPVVAAATIMSGIGTGLGFVAFIIPGLILLIRWAVVAQAAALEGDGWLDALHSSGRLTKGNYGHVFALLLAAGVLSFAVHLVAISVHAGNTSGAASVALGIAIDTIVASFQALTLALLYFDLCARVGDAATSSDEHEETVSPFG
jgi:hypothetical protein